VDSTAYIGTVKEIRGKAKFEFRKILKIVREIANGKEGSWLKGGERRGKEGKGGERRGKEGKER